MAKTYDTHQGTSQLSESRPHLGNICVLGLGSTGYAVGSYCAERLGGRVDGVRVYAGLKAQESPEVAALRAAGCEVILGTEQVEGSYDLAISSPGISEFSPFFQAGAAHAAEIIGEPEFAWRESPELWCAITGTNGKTTTTTLTRDLLRAAGQAAEAVGNIGTLAISAVARRTPGEWLVAELSSYQLATTSLMHPRIAVLLNISPDHLTWHQGKDNYIAAKRKIFANLDADDLAVVSVDDASSRAIAEELMARGLRVCALSVAGDPKTPRAAYLDDGALYLRRGEITHKLVALDELQLIGAHNAENALAAAVCAAEAGSALDAIRAGLRAFRPLEHRTELVGEVAGVRYVDDSKATNTDAAERALSISDPAQTIVLLGGHDKGTPLDGFAQIVSARARVAVCYGEAGPRFAAALRAVPAAAACEVVEAPHMADALAWAHAHACPGDTVLLSPACSSFDEFSGFEERGDAFKAQVRRYLQEASN